MKLARFLYALMLFITVWSPVASAFGCPMANMSTSGAPAAVHSPALHTDHQQTVRSQVADLPVNHAQHVNGAEHSHCLHPGCSNGGHCGYVVIGSRTLYSDVPGPATLLHAVHPLPISGQTSLPFRPPIS